jgi:hypothetical protein
VNTASVSVTGGGQSGAPTSLVPCVVMVSGNGSSFSASVITNKTLLNTAAPQTGTVFAHVSGSGPSVTLSTPAPLPPSTIVEIDIVAGGALGSAAFNFKINGALSGAGIATGSSVPLGTTGLTAMFGAGTYSTTNVYFASGIPSAGTSVAFAGLGSSPPAITLSAAAATTPPPPNAILEIDIELGGPVGTATFAWRQDGVVQASSLVTAPSVALGSGLVATFAPGTYGPTDVYRTSNGPSALASKGIANLNPPTGQASTLLGAVDSMWAAWVIARGVSGANLDTDLADIVSAVWVAFKAMAPAMPGTGGGTLRNGIGSLP